MAKKRRCNLHPDKIRYPTKKSVIQSLGMHREWAEYSYIDYYYCQACSGYHLGNSTGRTHESLYRKIREIRKNTNLD